MRVALKCRAEVAFFLQAAHTKSTHADKDEHFDAAITAIDAGNWDTQLLQGSDTTFKMCDLATITLEKISTGVSVTEKKLEKARKKSDNNLAKQLSLKEAEVQRLESEFKHTEAKAQNLKAQEDEALAKIISLKSEVKDFFVSAGSSQEKALLERNLDVIFVRDSSKLNAENLPFFAEILSPEG